VSKRAIIDLEYPFIEEVRRGLSSLSSLQLR
jgi:hypothetical protein